MSLRGVIENEVITSPEELTVLESILSERKKKDGLSFYIPNQHQLKCHQSEARFVLLCGANRIGKCVTISTLIDTPEGEISMGELYRRGKSFEVYAWDGEKKVVAKAKAPFRKGKHQCFRIEMSDGRFIEAADHHRLLTSNGLWSHVDDLQRSFSGRHSSSSNSLQSKSYSEQHKESSPYLQNSNSEPYQLAHVSGVLRYEKREQGYQDGYSKDFRLCDERPLSYRDIVQSSAPSLDDVQQQALTSSYWDAQENKCNGNLLQSLSHLSTQDDQTQSEGQFGLSLLQTSYTTCLLFGVEPPEYSQLSHVSCSESQPFHEAFAQDSQYSFDSYESPLEVDGNSIVSYHSIGIQEVYDFEVEIYHNYFAGGLINHNSTAGAAELCFHLTRNYPDWWSIKRRFKKPIKAIVVGESNAFIEKVLEPKLKQYLPQGFIKHEKRVTGGYLNRIECKDGSVVDFLTKEQSDMSFEGADWDFYWGDEPQGKRKFDAIQRGLVDRQGFGVITFTPLIEPWMKEELVDKADGKFIEVITASIFDNMTDIQGNAILSKDAIEEWKRTLSEDVAQTRIFGKFFHLRGTVYTEFSDIHQQRFQYNYPDPVICVLDPHDRQPHHVIWAIVTPDDDLYVHTELAVHCTVEELAQSILRIEKGIFSEMNGPNGEKKEIKTGYRMRRRLIDPNFGRKPLITTGRNMIEELARAGCPGWAEADDPKEEGHLKVKDYLHYEVDKPVSLTNKPKLYFHKDRVPMTIRSMRNYQYSEWVGKTNEERDPKEEPKQKDTHGADCVRYLCMSNPSYTRALETASRELESQPY